MNQNGDQTTPQIADVGAQRIARVYAEALLNAAEQSNQVEAIAEEVDSLVQDVFRADPQFEAFLSSGAIGRHHKEAVLKSVFEGRASPLFLNFLLVLNHHERLELLRAIRVAFRSLLDERAHRIRVEVRSAVPLPDDQRERLAQELRATFHLEPVLVTQVDPDLLGGMTVRVGDWLFDGSVRTRLNNIRKEIIESSSHEIQSRRDQFCNPA